MGQDDPSEVGRRVRAARAYADDMSQPELGEALGSASTIKRIEAGKRIAQPHELEKIATACGLPVEFFTIDFSFLPALIGGESPEHLDDLVQERAGQVIAAFVRLTQKQANGTAGDDEESVLADFIEVLSAYEARAESDDEGAASASATATPKGGA